MTIMEQIEALPKGLRKILKALMGGGKYSVADLCIMTHASDPRGHIRSLRQRGFKIFDMWMKSETDPHVKYKVYWFDIKDAMV